MIRARSRTHADYYGCLFPRVSLFVHFEGKRVRGVRADGGNHRPAVIWRARGVDSSGAEFACGISRTDRCADPAAVHDAAPCRSAVSALWHHDGTLVRIPLRVPLEHSLRLHGVFT
jgi:hypothetical protein